MDDTSPFDGSGLWDSKVEKIKGPTLACSTDLAGSECCACGRLVFHVKTTSSRLSGLCVPSVVNVEVRRHLYVQT